MFLSLLWHIVCGELILPNGFRHVYFLPFIQFAQLIVPYRGEESRIPPIIKRNGKPFVTVHHFSAISGVSDLPGDSTEILDRAENMIVCCPHHHSFLENHGGGFHEAYKDKDGNVWLSNKNGEQIKLVTNYHFLKDKYPESQADSMLCEKEVV